MLQPTSASIALDESDSTDEAASNSGAASDDALVGRVRGGDLVAFELLMRRHNRRLFRAARAIVRSDDEAEDVMQHAYVRAFEHLSSYAGRARFSTWLTRIAVYEALRRLRQSRRARAFNDSVEAQEKLSVPQFTPEQTASDAELRSIIEAAIDALPLVFRTVFVLRAVEQMNVADVAMALSIPDETVKTRYFRARQRLREQILERIEGVERQAFPFYLLRCDRVVAAVLSRLQSV